MSSADVHGHVRGKDGCSGLHERRLTASSSYARRRWCASRPDEVASNGSREILEPLERKLRASRTVRDEHDLLGRDRVGDRKRDDRSIVRLDRQLRYEGSAEARSDECQ